MYNLLGPTFFNVFHKNYWPFSPMYFIHEKKVKYPGETTMHCDMLKIQDGLALLKSLKLNPPNCDSIFCHSVCELHSITLPVPRSTSNTIFPFCSFKRIKSRTLPFAYKNSPFALVVLNSKLMSSSARMITLFLSIGRLMNEFPFTQLQAMNKTCTLQILQLLLL